MADTARVLADHVTDWVPTRPVGVEEPVGALSRVRRHTLRRVLFADAVGLAFAALLGPRVFDALNGGPPIDVARASRFDVVMIPMFLAVFALYGLYRGVRRRIATSVFSDLRNILHALIIGGFLYTLVDYVSGAGGHTQPVGVAVIATMCGLGMVTVPAARMAAFGVVGRHSLGTLPVIVVGTGKLAETVASHLRAHPNVQFVGYVDDDPVGSEDLLGQLDDLPVLCRRFQVARVVVCFSRTHPERTTEMLKGLAGQVGVSIVPRYYELLTARSHVEDLSGLPMLDIAPASLSIGARFLKRAFDLTVSSVVLLVAGPALLVVAAMIKATTPGPVFFRQLRTGRNEQPFAVFKFRTMYQDAEARRHEVEHLNEMDGPLFKAQNDPRITPVGRVLRRTSLDEFAQLINVWKGDMSLVGPRPFVVAEAMEIEGWARKRFEVRPGMTGLWQVSGRNELSHLELCRLDYLYVASWSFWWDMEILWRTPRAVLRGRGAS